VEKVLSDSKMSFEIIVVNDGSRDMTGQKALNHSRINHKIKSIGYNNNQGKGFAIKKGFISACGDAVIFIDCDSDIDPGQIKSYFHALNYGDVVVGSKRHPLSTVNVPFLRRFLSYGFNILVTLLTGLRIHDTQTGLKAVRRKALEPVFSVLSVRRFAYDVELLSVANLFGLKIIELPVEITLSNIFFSPFEMYRMFLDLLQISYRLRVSNQYRKFIPEE